MEFSNPNGINNKMGQESAKNARSLSFADIKQPATSASRTADKPKEISGHRLELDPERAMSMTGVRDVPVFTDKNITIRLANETLLVTGQNLAVKTLDVENGKLQVTGRVFSLRYTTQTAPASVIKRIFK